MYWKGLTAALFLFLAGCGAEAGTRILADPVPDQVISDSVYGVAIAIEEIRQKDSELEIHYSLENTGAETFGYGGYAALERKTESRWHGVIYSDAVFHRDPGFRDSGKHLAPGGTDQLPLSTSDLGVTLSPGQYRIVKTLTDRGGREFAVATELVIE